MKISKLLVSVSILTFAAGYVSVVLTKKASEPVKIVETAPKEILLPQTEKLPELETIEEVNSWTDEEPAFKIKLLETGEGFHGDEVPAKNGEKWLGLFAENGEFFLRSTKLKIKRVHDPVIDESVKIKTGKSVTVSGKSEPIFLVKNAANLSEGKIETLFKGVTWNEYDKDPALKGLYSNEVFTIINKDFRKDFSVAGKKIELKTFEAKNKENERILALALEGDGKRQILHTVSASEYGELGVLYWAGDLDKDGMPDFYIELYEHYNAINKVLFLSSEVEKDKLVKKVAYFWITGC